MKYDPVFEAIQGLLARALTVEEMGDLAAALAKICGEEPSRTTEPGKRHVADAGVALIKRFEGCAKARGDGTFAAYPDPGTGGPPWTIGWGATGRDIGRTTVWTQAQFDALASFHYNTGAIGRATLTKRHMAGDYADARRQFARWNRAGGRVLKGLTRRRKAEAALYAGDG